MGEGEQRACRDFTRHGCLFAHLSPARHQRKREQRDREAKQQRARMLHEREQQTRIVREAPAAAAAARGAMSGFTSLGDMSIWPGTMLVDGKVWTHERFAHIIASAEAEQE